MASPTSRSLAELRKLGWRAEVVERHNTFSSRKNDLFGFIDILAIAGDFTLGVQATSTPNLAARVRKIEGECRERAAEWLEGEGRLLACVGWRRYAARVDGRLWRPTWRWIESV